MKIQKFKNSAFSLLVLLSFFVSSASACTCFHFSGETATESSACHGHSDEIETENHHAQNQKPKVENEVSEPGCCCFESSPKIVVKSETIKIEKQQLALNTYNLSVNFVVVPNNPTAKYDFSSPHLLTDYLYNLPPGRAPPRL